MTPPAEPTPEQVIRWTVRAISAGAKPPINWAIAWRSVTAEEFAEHLMAMWHAEQDDA